jgi:hypothetical protein
MADKPTLYIDYQGGKIKGPGEIIGRLFANPKAKSWYPPPEESMIVISDPQRFQQTVARLRELGYPLVETAPPNGGGGASEQSTIDSES